MAAWLDKFATMPDSHWQFWIDVGGTFTDCIARCPDGTLRRHKRLSSGVTKGRLGPGSTPGLIHDPARSQDPPDFWSGFRLRLLDDNGDVVAESTVEEFDQRSGRLWLAKPLNAEIRAEQSYELVSDEEAPVLAIRHVLGLSPREKVPPVSVRLGTTRGTNALLTRRGAATALVTTCGFGDILRIGYQNRPHLFRLDIDKPTPLFRSVLEVDERVSAEGQVLCPLDEGAVRRQLEQLHSTGIRSLAVCLLHAYRYDAHEQLIGSLAEQVGFDEVSLSSQVAPLIKIVSRGDTTVMNAYLNPVLRSYVDRLRTSLSDGRGDPGSGSPSAKNGGKSALASDLRMLTSAGGLVSADQFIGKDSILSGPAGGVVGYSRAAEAAGFPRAIGFDMGGTSTDVSRYDGQYELEYETQKAGIRVVAPMMAIETVAAGGGSICDFDGVKLVVGPDSAGAEPGPACYGRGGPLAVTDLNLFLGRLLPESFPFPLDSEAVTRRLETLSETVRMATGVPYQPAELAEGFLQVANSNMARAIRSISVAKGYDPRDYVLVAFGGAAGQHACAVADQLNMTRVLNHPDAGILSAYGIGQAEVARRREAGVYRPYSEVAVQELEPLFERLLEVARQEVLDEGVPAERIERQRSLDVRYQGVEATLNIACPERQTYAESFEREHLRRYGYLHANRPLEIVTARVAVIGKSQPRTQTSRRVAPRVRHPRQTTLVVFQGQAVEAAVFARDDLQPGDILAGPAIVLEPASTTVIDPHWRAEMLSQGELLLTRLQREVNDQLESDCEQAGTSTASTAKQDASANVVSTAVERMRGGDLGEATWERADPVLLEVFNNQFAGIAEQMGITLRNTSSSVNVKERLDFSCAIFTPTGDLVVNAPHIPVHLGAMSETVKCLLQDNPELSPGDVLVTNDPYRGGSHLPDVTVVTPVHDDQGRLLFLTASRAHHAEIGGIRPGSMPPFSRNLAEEGVLIRNFKLIDRGESRADALERLLRDAPYPSRAIADNLADVAAQVAANKQGANDLRALIDRRGLPMVQAYMRHIQSAATAKMRAALARQPAGRRTFVDYLDDGAPISVTVTIHGETATLDFSGSGSVLSDNLNANRAIVTAAVMYVLRCLIDEDIPLNQGVLEPVEIVLPKGLLNPPAGDTPETSPAVVGGNVETSQRVVDVLLGALGLAAASQGTMNNLLFGDATFGYYETICGGSGATADHDGADAVHTHMTNTRLTDPEVLEQRYPVRLRQFSIRRDSAGQGQRHGGQGVVRQLEFLRPLEVSILSQRRGPYPPYGLQGGQPGALGQNLLRRARKEGDSGQGDRGQEEVLPARAQFQVAPGDVLTIKTPGGGGYGAPSTACSPT